MDKALNFIYRRRSVRQFQPRAIAPEILNELLQAAMAAPSARCKDPWRFIVVTETELKNQLAEALPTGKFMQGAPAVLIVAGDIEAANIGHLSYLLQDCSAAIENILLAAAGLGLGSCWIGIHPREERLLPVSKLCRLPETVIPVGGIVLGYPLETPEARTRYRADFVHYNGWRQH